MKLLYEEPKLELIILSAADVITTSPGLQGGESGSGGGNISFNEWQDKLGNNGDGTEGDGLDIGIDDFFNGAT
ncbi:MAG: hypothetical protein IJY42_04365 [Clostridia bacterium]|nr:hypothetical protein [Clostridia bacterium]